MKSSHLADIDANDCPQGTTFLGAPCRLQSDFQGTGQSFAKTACCKLDCMPF